MNKGIKNMIFYFSGKGKKDEARKIILKEFFNYSDQKKAVNKAARESAEDQKSLIDRYDKIMMKQSSVCAK